MTIKRLIRIHYTGGERIFDINKDSEELVRQLNDAAEEEDLCGVEHIVRLSCNRDISIYKFEIIEPLNLFIFAPLNEYYDDDEQYKAVLRCMTFEKEPLEI
jgi:hypothetical protein